LYFIRFQQWQFYFFDGNIFRFLILLQDIIFAIYVGMVNTGRGLFCLNWVLIGNSH